MESIKLLTVLMKAMGIYTLIWGSIEALINIVAILMVHPRRIDDMGYWLVYFGAYSLCAYILLIKSEGIAETLLKFGKREG